MNILFLRTFFTLLLFTLSNPLFAQNKMFVKSSSGAVSSYFIQDLSKVTFGAGNMTLRKNDASNIVFPLNANTRYTFVEQASAVEVLKIAEISSLFIYPNPCSIEAQLNYHSLSAKEASIEFVDAKGNVVMRQLVTSSIGKNKVQLNVSKLSTGLYLLRISNGADTEAIYFMKKE